MVPPREGVGGVNRWTYIVVGGGARQLHNLLSQSIDQHQGWLGAAPKRWVWVYIFYGAREESEKKRGLRRECLESSVVVQYSGEITSLIGKIISIKADQQYSQ